MVLIRKIRKQKGVKSILTNGINELITIGI